MELSENVSSKLICSDCKNFLSKSPIFMKITNGKSLCGDCVKEEPVFRNTIYEKLARFTKFPCKYQMYGCNELVLFSQENGEKNHELACNFRQYFCPIMDWKCDWIGTNDKIFQHCYDNHFNRLILNTWTISMDLASVDHCEINYIIPFQKLIFLVCLEVLQDGQTGYAVKLLGDPDKASKFMFTIEIRQEDNVLIKTGDVLSEKFLEVYILDMDTFEFSVSINFKCGNCMAKVSNYFYRNLTGWRCDSCLPLRRSCCNLFEGCIHTDFPEKCRSHEFFFCSYTKNCLLCREWIRKGSLFVHYSKKHAGDTYIGGSLVGLMSSPWKRCILLCETTSAIFEYFLDPYLLIINVMSNLDSYNLHKHQCIVQYINYTTKEMHVFMPEASYNTLWDWQVQLLNRDYQTWGSFFNFSIDIKNIN